MREKYNIFLIGLLVQRDGENDERVWISKLERFICYLRTQCHFLGPKRKEQ